MNKCHFPKELSAYLDNQLSERRKSKIEKHLQGCPACSDELIRLKAVSEKLRKWQAPCLDVSFDKVLRDKIVAWELQGGRVKMKTKTLSMLVPSGAVAGILIVGFLGLQMYMKGDYQGRLRLAGEQYASGRGEAASLAGGKYEPYYLGEAKKSALKSTVLAKANSQIMGAARMEEVGAFSQGHALTIESRHSNKAFDKSALRFNSQAISYQNAGVISNDPFDHKEYLTLVKKSRDTDFEGITYKNAYNYVVADSLARSGYSPNVQQSSGYTPSPITQPYPDGTVIVIQPVLPATGEGEKIIRSAAVKLEVEDGKDTYHKISEICKEFGGYLAGSNFFMSDDGRQSGTVILRIPKDKFITVMDELGALGKVRDSHTESQDVSQEYANIKSELEAAKIVYDKMLEALKKRQNTIPDAVRLESELTPVLKRIEGLKNQIERLDNLTSFTAITVNFFETDVSLKVLEESKRLVKKEMLAAKIRSIRWFAQNLPLVGAGVIVSVLVFCALIALVGWISRLFHK